MNRSKKNDFVTKARDEFSKSSTIIVTHYSGLNVKEIEELRNNLKEVYMQKLIDDMSPVDKVETGLGINENEDE